ncbi:uncharacterized protein [Oryza sativa Japonica Group]|uniref:Mitochondrial carrier protein, expressed n=7 Tax=Oryza TaxID=4527 RepID=Q10NJ7_ORYSJ|nr:mitochondrial substrate carrier family protein B [Oryza sativa Japonica Group]KAB8091237.1 hypothetical protein EE612_016688 [Oryza sativa]ABF95161.1 Mitochondrial carrier protein, expressed [Oryza sativa Japonica Group]KAF2938504.1 hypothetical protein DAI22_03g123500 [Oryza sativa Japonica Group]BAF11581.1 Os03g0267700 [Oryza sativa Japonica Group]BAG97204.1 unnamed protein product [Oryza sativa Japonica Group]|eukprot:NP_001049667.1 Os03g0267700 [Oryza sativa Japonica Group]
MQTEARVGMAAATMDSGAAAAAARRYSTQQQQQQPPPPQLHHHQPQLGTVPHLLAGGVAGAVSKTCTAPLARLTILFQVQGMHSDVATMRKTSIWREASRIVYEEGFRAFWKGNLVTIAHRLPYSSISFYTYERYKNLLQMIPGLDRNGGFGADVGVRLIGGGLSGITAASMTYPLDLVRTRLAAQTNTAYYRGISHALYAICRDEGVKGLYKGLGATLLGVGPSIAISFCVYETLRSHWQIERPYDSPVLISLACGSLSGIASSTITFPLDLVRRRMQLEGAAGRARVYQTGLFGTFGHIVRTESLRGLYRGILPEYCKVVPSVGIVFMTYETLKSILTELASDD